MALQQLFRAEARLNARDGGDEGRNGKGEDVAGGRKAGGGGKND